jgi:hypothetical protein
MTVKELYEVLNKLMYLGLINNDTQIMIDNSNILEAIQCGTVDEIDANDNLNTLFIKQGV